MIRPDGKPHHPEDGWKDEGQPLSIAVTKSVKEAEFTWRLQKPWAGLMVDHQVRESKEGAVLWSPVVLIDSARKASSVSHVSAIVYDFDHSTRWEDVVDVLGVYGIRYWGHTTWSHSEEVHKFRVVLGIDEAIPAGQYRTVWLAVRDMLGWDVDEQCKDVSRLYYVPSCPAGAMPWQSWGDGDGIDWRAYADWYSQKQAAKPPQERILEIAKRRNMDSADNKAEATKLAFLRCLDQLDPDVAYHSWVRLGMVAKLIGMESEWSEWCQRGSKYRPGEPEKKLRSFQR